MQRPIIFRGMDNSGKWHYGNLTIVKTGNLLIDQGCYFPNKIGMPFAHKVNPETIGQFIGLLDKNGKLIYEDDVIRSSKDLFIVEWYFNRWVLKWAQSKKIDVAALFDKCEKVFDGRARLDLSNSGEKEVWYCSGCEKYFKRADGKTYNCDNSMCPLTPILNAEEFFPGLINAPL
jgi:hypothetical protein